LHIGIVGEKKVCEKLGRLDEVDTGKEGVASTLDWRHKIAHTEGEK